MKTLLTTIFTAVLSFCLAHEMNRKFYVSPSGNDANPGTISRPWRTIAKANAHHYKAGDTLLFEGGKTFTGSITIDSSSHGSRAKPIIISSYGVGYATINAGDSIALLVLKTSNIVINKLHIKGTGRKSGNTKDGLAIRNSIHVNVKDVDVSGFQKSGLLIYSSSHVSVSYVTAHDNGAGGISIEGPYPVKESCYDIYIGHCRAENNPGDPTNLTNHSGNGIVVGDCRKVLIEYCTATNNGWDMPRIGNGPVGIWAYEADSVIIQHCLSYQNKTSAGAADGGGYDLDGGVTNSIVQYCLSYGNQGAGYCIFQYLYASPWHDNIFRYNISENDGSVSDARAGVHIWNSSRDSSQFYNCLFSNNTIYNSVGAAISYSEVSQHLRFGFYNNIFIAQDSLIKGERGDDRFVGNDWWSIDKQFNAEGQRNFIAWTKATGSEQIDGTVRGVNVNPAFVNAKTDRPITAEAMIKDTRFSLPASSSLLHSGIDLHAQFHINTGNINFNHKPQLKTAIGASY